MITYKVQNFATSPSPVLRGSDCIYYWDFLGGKHKRIIKNLFFIFDHVFLQETLALKIFISVFALLNLGIIAVGKKCNLQFIMSLSAAAVRPFFGPSEVEIKKRKQESKKKRKKTRSLQRKRPRKQSRKKRNVKW